MHTQALISATSNILLCYYATSKPKASYNQVVFKNTGCPNTGKQSLKDALDYSDSDSSNSEISDSTDSKYTVSDSAFHWSTPSSSSWSTFYSSSISSGSILLSTVK